MQGLRPKAVTCDAHAVEHLVTFCREEGRSDLFVVADQNTYAVQGETVVAGLRTAGFNVKTIVFTNAEVVADAAHILDVLIAAGRQHWTYVVVGSGTLTDITRFVSHRTFTEFISVPTAPSVDGFASIGAPLIIHGVKESIYAHAPMAIFADIDILCTAPAATV